MKTTLDTPAALFAAHVHSPSFSTLTDKFEHTDQLKDYCIPVNWYFPTPGVMNALYRKLPYAVKYYAGGNSQIAETV